MFSTDDFKDYHALIILILPPSIGILCIVDRHHRYYRAIIEFVIPHNALLVW